MTPSVVSIVLSYRQAEVTLDCIASLQRQTQASQILVVDNASPDGAAQALQAARPEVELLALPENAGYAGGNNAGLKLALERGAEAVFLVNNDTVLEADCLAALARTLEADPRIGIIGPMVYTFDTGHIISSAGGQVDWRYADAVNVGMGEADHGQYLARPVDFINGCGLLITRAALEHAGLLDERYFMYWEETDWCQRVRRAGFEVYFEAAARMRHKAAITSEDLGPTTLYYMTRNRFRFFGLHTPRHLKPLALARGLRGALRGVQQHRRAGRPAHARATWLGILHAGRGQWGRADSALWLKG